jgi:hypothetical protein
MRVLWTILQVAMWGVGALLLVCLLGSLRWLSSVSDPTPEALFAAGMTVVMLVGFVTAFYLYETFAVRHTSGAEALA